MSDTRKRFIDLRKQTNLIVFARMDLDGHMPLHPPVSIKPQTGTSDFTERGFTVMAGCELEDGRVTGWETFNIAWADLIGVEPGRFQGKQCIEIDVGKTLRLDRSLDWSLSS